VTLIQLAQALHRDVGATGTAPASVVDARGEWARLVNYVIGADLDVQALWENWKFQRTAYSQAATPSTATLAAPTRIKMWDQETFKIREAGDAVGLEYPIEAVEYDDIKREVLDVTEGIPSRVIIMPDYSLKLEQVPNAAHVLLADHYVHPVALAANADVSVIPTAYHDVIRGKAVRKYANFEGAGEISQEAMDLYDLWLPRLENNQLPNKNNSRFRTGGFFEVIGSQ
jgi:hypothetical protein